MENLLADYGINARVKRLTWLVGPPGAGKSTFAYHTQKAFSRVLEFDEMLGPLVNEHRITEGVLRANNKLVEVVRQIELIPENEKLPSLLAVAGTLDLNLIFPLSGQEEVWVLLPEREQWRKQLKNRPTQKGDMTREAGDGGYKNFQFAEKVYTQIEEWAQSHHEAKIIPSTYYPEFIGKTYHEIKI